MVNMNNGTPASPEAELVAFAEECVALRTRIAADAEPMQYEPDVQRLEARLIELVEVVSAWETAR
jgi:hypothetical protein